ncbi:pyridoxal phosphate-dependent aminotransferase [Pedobacter gandavensis]|uniref:pyridoxal phosphate-dependent aminotransferase n=1 Tax=Pedobacter gandavensis TaxID=2679963 RepID=UPI00247A1D9C|nr:pyridoxal phosphate-dependent aminotransferase [Pedobacter gandavensis]WGQ10945.1 pyridoxal phosphate-dependent aminotransferase [Pedobacter gandavensis]
MNKELEQIPTYMSKMISDRASLDHEIINLSIGEPFFSPPNLLYDTFKENLFQKNNYDKFPNKYSESKGAYSLRNEIARRYRRLYSAEVKTDSEILITHGAAEAIWLSILTLTSLGDEVIIPDPSYTLYETAVKLLGRIPVKVSSSLKNGNCLEINELKKHVTEKTKLLIINSPENPTGAVYGEDLISKIADFTSKNNIYFLHDEVYDAFVFSGNHINILTNYNKIPDNCLLINSFSKRYSMMGWRLGWVIAGEKIISNMTKVHTNLTLNLGVFHQDSASKILNDQNVESEIITHRKSIENNMIKLWTALRKIKGIKLTKKVPKAGFFLFPNISELYNIIPKKHKTHNTIGESVAEYFLAKYKIAVVPGYIYGKCGEDCIRLVVAVKEEKINQVIYRIENY